MNIRNIVHGICIVGVIFGVWIFWILIKIHREIERERKR